MDRSLLAALVLCPLVGCAEAPTSAPAPASPTAPAHASPVTVAFDFAGAEALLTALEQPALDAAAAAKLLEVRGVAAMVDNAIQYNPALSRAGFVAEVQRFAATQKSDVRDFGLEWVHARREEVRGLIDLLRAEEQAMVAGMLSELEPHRPATGASTVKVYFVAGGSSDGFVLHDAGDAFFVALDKADGDIAGVRQNMAHELYHAMQKASARQAPRFAAMTEDPRSLPPLERLAAMTVLEGTANFAADASRSRASGPYIEMWRSRYQRNAEPGRIRDNFALFDRVLADLRSGAIPWEEAERVGFFGGENDSRFYFVGYQMTRVIVGARGPAYLDTLFQGPPWRLFKDYVAHCRDAPDCPARFAAETEAWIASLP